MNDPKLISTILCECGADVRLDKKFCSACGRKIVKPLNQEEQINRLNEEKQELHNANQKLIEENEKLTQKILQLSSSVEITNKIINEHEERLLQGAFPTVKIGNQQWMSKNLDVDCYANGDPIPQVQKPEEWKNLETGAWCYYNNDPENGKSFGKLYNWYAVNDPRGLAPKGWKIPSDEEWTILIDNLGGIFVAGTKMKNTSGWADGTNGNKGNSTSESGFSGLPGGNRDYDGTFFSIGNNGYWWSSTEDSTNNAWTRNLDYYNGDAGRNDYNKAVGFSVRCLRD